MNQEWSHLGDGHSVGAFVRLEDPHGLFPSRSPHDDSPPHITLISGLCLQGDYGDVISDMRQILATHVSTRIIARKIAEFTIPDGTRIFHLVPEFESDDLHQCRQKLCNYLVGNGYRFSFWNQPWKPHITWEYVTDKDRPLPDTVPTFEWVIREVEIWGYQKG